MFPLMKEPSNPFCQGMNPNQASLSVFSYQCSGNREGSGMCFTAPRLCKQQNLAHSKV